MKTKFLIAAMTVALTTSFAAVAADAPAKGESIKDAVAAPAAKAEPAKKKVKPHSHVEAKGGMVMEKPAEAKEQPGKPLHDHQKFHK
jgi:hypothetical protein